MRFASVAAIFLVILFTPVSKADIVGAIGHGQVAYLLVDPPRIERYDLVQRQWLSPVVLPHQARIPTKFHVDADGIYVVYDRTVYRYDSSGGSETHLLTANSPVHGIYSDGNLLIVNHSIHYDNHFVSIDKSTNLVIENYEHEGDPSYGSAIAPSLNKIFGWSQGDLSFSTYDDNGSFLESGDGIYHYDFPNASQVWLFPDETKVVGHSGTVYDSTSLEFLGSLSSSFDQIAFQSPTAPIILSGNTLVAYSDDLLPSGSRTLTFTPESIFVDQADILTFDTDPSQGNGIRVDTIAINTLTPSAPGPPPDPQGLSYLPDNVFLGADGMIYLVSKNLRSIFRWNPGTQRYEETIATLDIPDYVEYSTETHTIYLAYESGLIRKIDLNNAPVQEVPFVAIGNQLEGLGIAGSYVLVVDPAAGAGLTHVTYDSLGNEVDTADFNRGADRFIWSEENQKIYYLNDGLTPKDFYWEEINADGITYPSEPPGGIGARHDYPLFNPSGFTHPFRVSPDGSVVIMGSGLVLDATSLNLTGESLPNSIADATWLAGQLKTSRSLGGTTQYESWTSSYVVSQSKQFPGEAHQLIQAGPANLVGISIGANSIPTLDVMDGNFSIVAPPVLLKPFDLSVSLIGPGEIGLEWKDVSGEIDYVIERKIEPGGAWTGISTIPFNITSASDTTVTMGNTYSYRITARNGVLSSPVSDEVSIFFSTPPPPAGLNTTVLSSREIEVSWQDSSGETGFTLERRLDSGSSWRVITTLDADVTSYTDRSLFSETTYVYRIKATNELGDSAYSVSAATTTQYAPPDSPVLDPAEATATEVALDWMFPSSADSFTIERRLTGTSSWGVIATRFSSSYDDTSVSPGMSYDYRVKSHNGPLESSYSNIVTAITPNLIPEAPTIATRPLSSSGIRITWAHDHDSDVSFRLERSVGDSNSWSTLANLPSDSSAYNDHNVTEGVNYHYRIQVVNSHGSSLFSDAVSDEPRTVLNSSIVGMIEHAEIVYLLIDRPGRIERFDLTSQQWLSPIDFSAQSNPPSAIHVDDDGIYVAFGTLVFRYDLAGGSEVHLVNATDLVHGIFSDGDLLLINHTWGSYTRFLSINKLTNTTIDSFDEYLNTIGGAAIAPGLNRIVGRSRSGSPSDITSLAYDDAGNFLINDDSPHHGAYPDAGRVWFFPDEGRVVDDSGTIYESESLRYVNRFPTAFQRIAFHGADIPIVLTGSTLTAYTNGLLATGSTTLTYFPDEILVHQDDVFTFTVDELDGHGVRVGSVPLSSLNAEVPESAINPMGMTFTPDEAFVGSDGLIYLFSKAHQAIFRWDPVSQEYGASIYLEGVPEHIAYSPGDHVLYLARHSGEIRKLDLNDLEAGESVFVTLGAAPLALATAGSYLFAADSLGDVTHYTYDVDGNLVDSEDTSPVPAYVTWSEVNQKMYFVRGNGSPNNLIWEEINEDGVTYPSENPGGIGFVKSASFPHDPGFSPPIRISPDGAIAILGSGFIQNARSLDRLESTLANSIIDALWLGSDLKTFRTVAGNTEYQGWGANYIESSSKQFPEKLPDCFP